MLRHSARPPQSGMRVLVVDDDPIFRSLVTTKLERCGHSVAEAEDGAVAWSLVAAGSFQLALVDLEMPNFKGIELIRCVRSHPKTCRLPVVVITSRNDSDAVRASLEAGATSFMTKPLNWSMFSNHIDFLLRLHGAAERGHEAEERVASMARGVAELIGKLEGVLAEVTHRIVSEASRGLAVRNQADGSVFMAEALERIAGEASQARARLAQVIEASNDANSENDEMPAVRQHAS